MILWQKKTVGRDNLGEFAPKFAELKEEISEIITHLSFYVGWLKAWSPFNRAKEIWIEE
ncbi:hypothetical protein ACVRZD_03030 [Streptococcus hongkongensis]